MEQITLNGAWRLRGADMTGRSEEKIDLVATVPSMAQVTLMEAGILPADIYMGQNIIETERYENFEWWYDRTFTVTEIRDRAFLVFRGVDCLAEYFLNGEKIGESDNMFIAFEFDVSGKLREGENTFTVHIKSPIWGTHHAKLDLWGLGGTWNAPANTAIRRAPHSYGWDILPRAVTSGIWRDVYLEFRDKIRFTQTFFDFRNPFAYAFRFDTESDLADFRDVEIEVSGVCGDSEFSVRKPVYSKAGSIVLAIPRLKKWWPRDFGEQNLYDMTLRIYSEGNLVHEKKERIGIRSIELDRTAITDGENGRFRFIINGQEIFIRGTNWVPMDAFHCRDKARYGKALELLYDSNCNMVRCWGGNVYEDHEFFDFCDEKGILVWQDFAMACANYPQDDDFAAKLYREAEWVIREYRNHPSLAIWCGDNEVDQFNYFRKMKPSDNRLTREVLYSAVARNDAGRPYLESSPYIEDCMLTEKGKAFSEEHMWGSRDYYKASYYKENKSHFASELGYHGCPSLESLKKFIRPEKLWPYAADNEDWRLHSADRYGTWDRVMLMERQVRQLFGEVPTDPETYITASQISQAEADKYLLERMRIDRPRKSGVIWWNLIDGWPSTSDAVVDYYYEKKLAYRYIQRSQAPFAIMADELRSWTSRIVACNDTLVEKRGKFRIYDVVEKRTRVEKDFVAAPNCVTDLVRIPLNYSDHRLLIFTWELEDGTTGMNHYLAGFPSFSLAQYLEWLDQELI